MNSTRWICDLCDEWTLIEDVIKHLQAWHAGADGEAAIASFLAEQKLARELGWYDEEEPTPEAMQDRSDQAWLAHHESLAREDA